MVHHEWWNTVQSYFTILERQEMFRELVADVHARGIGYIPYFGFQISEKAPEFPVYYPFVGTRVAEKPYVAPNVPPARSYPVDYTTIWGDHWIRGIGEFVRNYPVDGIYMDGTLGLVPVTRDDGRFPMTDSRGRTEPYFPTLEKRRFAILLHQQTRSVRPDLVWDYHRSSAAPGASSALATVLWNGEQMWEFVDDWKVPVDVYRAQFNGRLYGVPIQHLSNRWNTQLERDLGITLLFDALPRPMKGLTHSGTEAAFKIWRIMDEQNLRGEFFTPFYSSENPYRDAAGGMLVSAYETPGHTVLIVSNYENATASTAKILLGGTPFANIATAPDLWNGESFPVEGGILTVPVGPEGFRLLLLAN